MRLLTIVLLSFNTLILFAQEASIKGRITSQEEAIPFANIVINKGEFGTSSDVNGYYDISSIPAGEYTIKVSSIGYYSSEQKLIIKSSRDYSLDFQLEENAAQLGEVVVTANMKEVSRLETPVPVEVYSKEFFRANPTPSVFESMQNVNGVRPQLNCNVCNTGDIHINGLEGPYTMVLIDGMPIVSGLSTVYGLTGIPQSLIERIEIVKGPASTLYGSEAVGGLINIITKKPYIASPVSVDIFASDWAEVNTDIGLAYSIGKRSKMLTGINYFNYQNPIDRNNDGFTDLTLQDRISVFNKWSLDRKDNKAFSIAFRYVYEDRWGGQMNWEPRYRGGNEVYGESIYTNRWETFGIYSLPVSEKIDFQFSANGHEQNSVYGETVYIADQLIGFGQLSWHKDIKRHELLLGAAYRYTYYDDNTTATTTSGSDKNSPSIIHLPSIFIQDDITMNKNNRLLMGMRYDYNSVHGNIFSPRINYKWSTTDKEDIVRLSIGNGYRVANVFTEDHAALTGAREVVFADTLNPETSWNVNINYVKQIYTTNKTFIGLDLTAFYTYFTNRILPDYETDQNKIIYSNLSGYSISKGISGNVEVSLLNGLRGNAGITIMDVSVVENGERYQQLLTESFQGVWSIGYTFPKYNLSIDYTGNVYGPMRLPLLGELDDRPEYSPWWSIQNIQLTKTLNKNWEIYGGIKNLLNFTPPSNSIARAFDPFDKNVQFTEQGEVIPTDNNPNALTFDPSYVYAANQGIRAFLGFRFKL